MDTINTLLSLVELRIQQRDVRGWRRHVPLFLQLLRSLSAGEAHLLCQRLLALYPLGDKKGEEVIDLLAQINMFVPTALAPFLPTLLSHQQFFPPYLYLSAGKETCQQLLSLIHEPPEGQRSHLLQDLAWIGTEEVQAQFSSWRLHPPDWRSELFIPPENYSFEAGWELTADGTRRDLYSSTCCELILAENRDPFQMMAEEQTTDLGRCFWCQRPLQKLLDLNLRDPRCRWISAEGERLCVAVCTRCSYHATTYLAITLTGEALWSQFNGERPALLQHIPDDGEWLELPEPLVPGIARRTPFEAIGRFLLDEPGISQLGGHPEWIGDAIYPLCPSCRQRMPFLGQVAFEDWEDSEGVFYIFLCLPCRKAATHYQQT